MNLHAQHASFSRRDLLRLAASGAAISSLAGCASMGGTPLGRVVVVGGVGAGVAIDQTRPPSCPDGLGCVIVKE